MSIENTLSIIKPDAFKKNLVEIINKMFTDNHLKIIQQKQIQLSVEEASQFYAIHKNRPFFNDLINFMSSGPVIVQVLQGENAVAKNREIMGATNPKEAQPGTIRNLYAESIDHNCVHGSDSVENAAIEIQFFFPELL